jgi:hypothetical protein
MKPSPIKNGTSNINDVNADIPIDKFAMMLEDLSVNPLENNKINDPTKGEKIIIKDIQYISPSTSLYLQH